MRAVSPALLRGTHLVGRVPDFLQILLQHLFWGFTCENRVISGPLRPETEMRDQTALPRWAWRRGELSARLKAGKGRNSFCNWIEKLERELGERRGREVV